jgi:predicted phage-related endonuclease
MGPSFGEMVPIRAVSGTTSIGSDRQKAAHICVLICGHETRIFKVTRSESVIQHIINAERYFWDV